MKYTLSATIPTGQYANIQPSIEVEAPDFQTAHAEAAQYIEQVWAQYGTAPLNKQTAGTSRRLKAFTGGEIDYDEVNHIYSWNGEIYESGSQYAKKFEKPFDGAAIATKMAAKYNLDSEHNITAEDIVKMWELKARTSREFGTALHSALELYGKYNGLAEALERDTAMHDHPVIKQAVQSFYATHKDEQAEYEVLIVDHKNKRAGQIDRLLVKPNNTCRVQDFKCNAVMSPDKLKVYWKQLEFYGKILIENGWIVEAPEIFHYDGSWHGYTM